MSKASLLLADNNDGFRSFLNDYLTKLEYEVIQAANPNEALSVLTSNKVDVAILDIRLENDWDDKDISGLHLAIDHAPDVPKIIVTRYPEVKIVRQVLRCQIGQSKPLIDIIFKDEDFRNHDLIELERAIQDVLKVSHESRRQQNDIFRADLIQSFKRAG